MKRIVASLALALAIALPAISFAHGASGHLMGTVESVSARELVVKDRAGKIHPLKLDEKTRYRESGGGGAKASDLRAGDRVVVHFAEAGESAPAVEVRFRHLEK